MGTHLTPLSPRPSPTIGLRSEHAATDLGIQLSGGSGTEVVPSNLDFNQLQVANASHLPFCVLLGTSYSSERRRPRPRRSRADHLGRAGRRCAGYATGMSAAILSMLLGASGSLQVGDTAPDFTLPDTDGRPVTLSRLLERGPVVLFFFPKAFTPGCAKQAANFRDVNDDIEKKGAQVVAISVDDVDTLKRFKTERRAPYTFLSDTEKKVVAEYVGVMPVVGLAKRANVVIGQDGKIVSITEGSAAVDPTAAVGACPLKKP